MVSLTEKMQAIQFEMPTTLSVAAARHLIESLLPAVSGTVTKVSVTHQSDGIFVLAVKRFGKVTVGTVAVQLYPESAPTTIRFELGEYLTVQDRIFYVIPFGPKESPAYAPLRDLSQHLQQVLVQYLPGSTTTAQVASADQAPVAPQVGLAASSQTSLPSTVPSAGPSTPRSGELRNAPPGMAWTPARPEQTTAGTALAVLGGLVLVGGLVWARTGFYADQAVFVVLLLGTGAGLLALGVRIQRQGRPRLVPEHEIALASPQPGAATGSGALEAVSAAAGRVGAGLSGLLASFRGEGSIPVGSLAAAAPQPAASHPAASRPTTAAQGAAAVASPVAAPGAVASTLSADDLRAVTDPTATGQTLFEIASRSPALRPLVALHPHTYDGLLTWLGSLGDPQVDAALARRPLAEAGDVR